MHWSAKYIGIPYEIGGRGPDKVDCWGLVQMVYQKEFSISLPSFPGISVDALMICRRIEAAIGEDWVEVLSPFDGAAVAMSQREIMHHVGVYAKADGGKIIHGWESHHVVADTVRNLRFKGFLRIKYYRHRLWPTSLKPQILSSLSRMSRSIA